MKIVGLCYVWSDINSIKHLKSLFMNLLLSFSLSDCCAFASSCAMVALWCWCFFDSDLSQSLPLWLPLALSDYHCVLSWCRREQQHLFHEGISSMTDVNNTYSLWGSKMKWVIPLVICHVYLHFYAFQCYSLHLYSVLFRLPFIVKSKPRVPKEGVTHIIRVFSFSVREHMQSHEPHLWQTCT